MPRPIQRSKETSFVLRIDSALKAAFTAATDARDRPAAEVVRAFMRSYVKRAEILSFEAEARRQSRLIAQVARDPDSDEARVMREIEAELADPAFWSD